MDTRLFVQVLRQIIVEKREAKEQAELEYQTTVDCLEAVMTQQRTTSPRVAHLGPSPGTTQACRREGVRQYQLEHWPHALPLLTQASTAGDKVATLYRASMLMNGHGCTRDRDTARLMIHEVLHHGGTPALTTEWQTAAGLGHETLEQFARAAELYSCAAAQGDNHARVLLGLLCLHGRGVPRDPAKGVTLCRQAAKEKCAAAYKVLGDCNRKSNLGVPQDEPMAVVLFYLAACQGHADALFNLGVCYEHGIGVALDMNQSVAFYRLAVGHDHLWAKLRLSGCYFKGRGVARDDTYARKLFEDFQRRLT